MSFNDFISAMLNLLAQPIKRLRNPLESLSIQIDLQNNTIFRIIHYFIKIKPKYKYMWETQMLEQRDNYNKSNNFQSIDNYNEFKEFYSYMITNNIFSYEEAEWLEDAIHDILVD